MLVALLTEPSATAVNGCLGFEGYACPSYPQPYGPDQWPTTYAYEGKFPADFIWGMGTAAYQIEGAYREDGRGASIWDTFTGADTVGMPGAQCAYCCTEAPCPINPSMEARGATGNVACDHYHVWRTDVALMKSMGLKHYRFSIAWPRVVPTGRLRDGVNERGMAFYSDLIDGLLEAGIEPWVTLYHWDLPQGLLDPPMSQGWWSRDTDGKPDAKILPDWLDYAELCFERFGDRVKNWITFNEPWSFLYLGSGWGSAPSIPDFSNMTVDPWIGGHNVLLAHAHAVDLYRRSFQRRQRGRIGITNNVEWREPASAAPEDVGAAERVLLFALGWFADPIFGPDGDYPAPMRTLYGDRLPQFTAEQRRLLKGSSDFFGLNHYGSAWASNDPTTAGGDTSYAKMSPRDLDVAASPWLHAAPWGLRKLLNWIARRYDGPPIVVTEGGWSTPPGSAGEEAEDSLRTRYYADYLSELQRAVGLDGVDVRGYFAWSLLDNFEWSSGYTQRFGTTYVDFDVGLDEGAPEDRQGQPTAGRQWRRRKASSCWLERVWKGQEVLDPNGTRFQGCVEPSVFAGLFEDPARPGCPIEIVVEGSGARLMDDEGGGRGAGFCAAPAVGGVQFRSARVSGATVLLDAEAEAGAQQPAGLVQGFWNRHMLGIEWSDGSTWYAVGRGPSDHRVK